MKDFLCARAMVPALSSILAIVRIVLAEPVVVLPSAGPLDASPPVCCTLQIPLIDTESPPGLQFEQSPWSRAACVTGFLQIGGRKMSAQPTWTYLYYTSTTLWVGCRCEGLPGEKLKTELTTRDERIWRDDSVDLALNCTGDPEKIRHLVVNAAGTTYDAIGQDTSWNPASDIRISKDSAGWSVVIGITFKQLDVTTPRPGATWTANFCRNSSLRELSCWVPVLTGYLEPERFGSIVFGGRQAPAVQVRKLEAIGIGRNVLLTTCPPGTTLVVTGFDSRYQSIMSHKQPASTNGPTDFRLADDRICRVELAMTGAANEKLFSGSYPMVSAEVLGRLKTLAGHVSDAKEMLPKFPAAARAKAERLLTEAAPALQAALESGASPENRSKEDCQRLDTEVTALLKQLDGVCCYARTLAESPEAGFAAGFAGPMSKVMIKDHPFEGHFDDHYSLSLARNEHEGFQTVVIPFGRDLSDASVSVSELKSDSGAAFDGRIEVSLVGHVDVADNPPYETDYKGWWPDPLLSFIQKCDVKEGEHVAFWIDVATRTGTKAGLYEGTITVSARDVRSIRLKLKVQVWDFALPDGTHLRNAFTYNEGPTGGFYKDRWNDEMRRRYHDFILDHRLNIDHLYRHDSPDIELLKYGASRGMNAFNVGGVFRVGKGKKTEPSLLAYLRELKQAKLFDFAYVYGFDEVRKEKFAEVKEVFGEIHKRFPGLETMTTANDPSFGKRSGLRDVVDIWVPLTDRYSLTEARELRRQHNEMWWYICVVPIHPYANWFVEYPAIEARLLTGAMSYKYQVGGFLYYLINLWEGNRKPISKGPYADWDPGSLVNEEKKYTANGDGSLLCPGPDGPLSTIRLENIRDGFEDYEYLWLLRETVKSVGKLPPTATTGDFIARAETLLAVPDQVVTSTINYTRTPKDLEEFRTHLAEAIIEGHALLR